MEECGITDRIQWRNVALQKGSSGGCNITGRVQGNVTSQEVYGRMWHYREDPMEECDITERVQDNVTSQQEYGGKWHYREDPMEECDITGRVQRNVTSQERSG